MIGVAGGVVVAGVSAWAADASFEQQGSRTGVLVGSVVVFVVVVGAVAAYFPYGVLSRAGRWVNADSSKMRMWFSAPIIAALVAVTVQILATLTILADSVDGSGGSSAAASWAIVLSVGLPSVAWLISGGGDPAPACTCRW